MEMESSRRSIDRSREPGLKKPRLVEDTERDRSSNGIMDRGRSSFPSRVSSTAAAPTSGAILSRVRGGNERDDSVRAGVQQQQLQQHTHQELVSQYKSALAELTFNSKPIITNLTIIAGENLHAAKWIAGTVCANIIEVPSDQKLPSLYLLDSIVKNIGRDYIKYFATKLPEVFCKAYRQVDSSIHPGMRHLFGTWKGVFPAACLQMIDKELGFTPAINGSSSGAPAAKPDSQSQRPAHSIHVNPKYLEARQRLQQSGRAKGTNDDAGTLVAPVDDAETPDETAIVGRGRPWTDLPAKMNDIRRPQRETLNEPVHEKKASAGDEDDQYGSDLFRPSDLGVGRASERITERGLDNSWYGVGSNAAEATVSQRNSLNSQHRLSNSRDPRSRQANAQLKPTQKTSSRISGGIAESWKNSEEEEFMWDEMSSRLKVHGGPDSSRKDNWTPEDAEMLEFEDGFRQPLGDHDIGLRIKREASTDLISSAKRRQAAFGHQTSSMWPSQDLPSINGLNHKEIPSRFSGLSDSHPTSLGGLTSMSSSLARSGLQTLAGSSVVGTSSFGSLANTVSGAGGVLGQQRLQPLRPASPSGQSYSPLPLGVRQHQESNNFIKPDQPQTKLSQMTSQPAGQLNRAPHIQNSQDSFPIIPQNQSHPGSMRNLQLNQSQTSQNIQASSPLMSFPQLSKYSNSSQQPHQDLTQTQPSGLKPLPYPSVFGTQVTMGTSSVLSHSSNPSADIPGQLSKSSLLAAIMKSGLLSNNSVSGDFPNLSFQDSGLLLSQSNVKPPLPTGPPPTQLATSSPSMVSPVSASEQASHGSKSSLTTHHKRTAVPPPLPPGPPPTSSIAGSTSLQTSNLDNAVPNPLSSLLNSLVVKGLISSPAIESPNITEPILPSRVQKQSAILVTSSSFPISSSPASLIMPSASSGNEAPALESTAMSTAALPQIVTTEKTDLIGIEFKPEIIRETHPSVLSDLFDNFPHSCSICGLRLKLQERLERHLEWHAAKTSEANSSHGVSREWYANKVDWISGTEGSNSGPMPISMETSVKMEESEPAVIADESQCVCVLCGELFEDFYSHEMDEWMFKGAVYMRIPAQVDERGTSDENSVEGPIVHASCISPSSAYDLGLAKNVKQEPMD